MNKVIRALLPVLVVAAGAAVAMAFIKTAPKTPKAPAKVEATLVEVIEAEQRSESVDVEGQGSVVAARSVVVKAEVAGRVVWLSPNFVPGGRLKANDLLFKIDDRDYALAVEQQSSNLQRARFELAQEKGRVRVAEKEWKLLGESASTTPEGTALALREPQLKSVQAALASAESSLAIAKLNVQRTKVRAPFNAFVKDESLEVGQLVDRQGVLGTIVGTDEFWVEVSLPVSDLRWVQQPDSRGRGGSAATIIQTLPDGTTMTRPGRLVRLAGDLDPKGRMARLIVSVSNPMDTKSGELPLLLGAYVQVGIHGKTIDNVVVLPRRAVHTDDQVWVMGNDDKLEIRTAKIVFRGQEQVYVNGGIEAGERVITSRIATPVAGMALRLPGAAQPESTPTPEAEAETDAQAKAAR